MRIESFKMKLLTISLVACLALAGCASPSEVDLSKSETSCAQKCSANLSTCLSAFTIFPIMQNNQCVDGLKSCASACPVKGSDLIDLANPASSPMEQAKSKCLDLGFKVGTESFGQCILKVSK